MKEAKEVK